MSQATALNSSLSRRVKLMQERAALYGQVFNLGLQSTLIYRWNFLLRAIMNFLPLIASLFLWRAVFAGKSQFQGYDYSLMMAYFISLIILDLISNTGDLVTQISEDIKEGRLSQSLVKPLSYRAYRLSIHFSTRCIDFAVTIWPIALVLFFMRNYFHEIPVGSTFLPSFLALLGASMLQFSIAYAAAMVSFWLLEVGSVFFIIVSFEFLAGGHVFPLDLLPAPFYHASMTLPFAYEYYFPAAIFLGRIQGEAMFQGFVMQLCWIFIFFALGDVIWKRGLKKYTSAGG